MTTKSKEQPALTYAGIGPRSTPPEVLSVMSSIGTQLASAGWLLRSGHANGADQAFETGCDAVNPALKEIFLPWEGFNQAHSDEQTTGYLEPSAHQVTIAARSHPAWDRCKQGAKLLLARNVPILLGETLSIPVDCVITWLPTPDYQGGTRHALNIASLYGIPVFDIGRGDTEISQLEDYIAKRQTIRDSQQQQPVLQEEALPWLP